MMRLLKKYFTLLYIPFCATILVYLLMAIFEIFDLNFDYFEYCWYFICAIPLAVSIYCLPKWFSEYYIIIMIIIQFVIFSILWCLLIKYKTVVIRFVLVLFFICLNGVAFYITWWGHGLLNSIHNLIKL